MTKQEQLKAIFDKNGLEKEDIFMLSLGGKQIPIITRSGIEKIQAVNNIDVKFKIIRLSEDFKTCLIKAYGSMPVDNGKDPVKTIKCETYGEVNPNNTKQSYPVNIAEKRALSRVVLKLTGLYSHGIYGEDEADEFKQK